jgi:DNA modification methylase
VLDTFSGAGSTLIACVKHGRVARLIEIDPKYCDVIIRRWQDWSGEQACDEDGRLFYDAANDGR